MRKWLIAAFVAILSLGGYQAGQASAYTGGLLDGKTLRIAYNQNIFTSSTTTLATDNNETTYYALHSGSTSTTSEPDHLEYSFSSPKKITGYKIKATPTSTDSMFLILKSTSGVAIYNAPLNTNATQVTFSQPYVNVSQVFIYNNSTTDRNIYEWDLFGSDYSLSAPTGLTGTPGDQKVVLNWTSPTGATDLKGFNVYRNGVKVNTSLVLANGFTVTGLTNGTTYSFTVAAVDTYGNESAKSNAISLTPVPPPDTNAPAKPTGLTGTVNGLSVHLTWNANTEPDLAGYNVYQNGTLANSARLTTTSYTLNNLAPKTTYKYQVVAIDTDGNVSQRSDVISLTTPDVMSVTMVGNADSIIVQISGGSPPYLIEWDGGSQTVNATSFTVPDLEEDTDYTITVTDGTGKTITKTVNTGHMKAFVPPVFPAPDHIYQNMLDMFGTAGTIAITIIGGAVALGIICILGIWGWRLLKRWLAAAR